MQNEYTFGYCDYCKQFGALRNGECIDCQEKNKETIELPDFMKDIFKPFEKEE